MSEGSGKLRWWPAPAKLNLCLAITGRYANGYHALQTAFQFIDLADKIRFHPTTDGQITRHNPLDGVPTEDDLTVRAAVALRNRVDADAGVSIEIDKVIPMGAGLGGGSSDAATTLIALNALWRTRLDVGTLADLGQTLGADVPVFIRGRAAWGEGIGEKLTPARFTEQVYTIVVPPVTVATANVFKHTDLTVFRRPIRIPGPCPENLGNDLEPVTRALYPEVAEALDWLSGFGAARMTGTGGAVFATMASIDEAESVRRAVPDGWRSFVVRGMNDHPLIDLGC